MYLLSIAAALAAQSQAAPAPGANWQQIGVENGMTVFLDPASIRRTGSKARFSTRAVMAAPMPDGSTSGAADLEFDCAARTGALYSLRLFAADGRVTTNLETTADDRREGPVNAGSTVDRAIFQRVCGTALPAPAPAPAQ